MNVCAKRRLAQGGPYESYSASFWGTDDFPHSVLVPLLYLASSLEGGPTGRCLTLPVASPS